MPSSSSASQLASQNKPFSTPDRLAIVLLSLGFNYTFMSGVIYPALPGIQQQYGLSSAQLSLMSSLPALVSVLFQPAVGWVSDRVNRKWIIITGLAAYMIGGNIVGIVLLSALTSYLWILLGRFLSGFGELGSFPQYLAVIHEKLPAANHQKMIGTMEAVTSMGSVIAPVLGGVLTAQALHYPFFTSALFGLMAFLLATWAIPAIAPHPAGPAPARAFSTKHFEFHFSYLAGFLIMGTLVATNTFLGSYFLKFFGFQSTQIGFMLAVSPLAMAGGASVAAKQGELGTIRTWSLALAGVIGVAGLVFLGYATSPLLSGLGLALSGLNLGYWLAAFDHDAMYSGSAETRGLRLSLFQQAKSLGILLFPFLLGVVIDRTGSINLIYWLLAGALLIIGCVLLRIRMTKYQY